MKNRQVEITASLPSVGETKVTIPTDATVNELKSAVCKEFQLEPEYTNLMFEDKALNSKDTIESLNLDGKKVIVDYLWARHLLLWNPQEQSRIRESTVLIAGAGALGNEVAKNLAMIGTKRLIIVDYDLVEMSNVSRMFLFGIDDVGKPKAEVLGAQIAQKYPFVEAVAYTCTVERLPLEIFLSSDVIISGLDNIASRIFLAAIAVKYQIPMVDGGTLGHRTRVQAYVPPDAACPACSFPVEEYAKLVNLRNKCDPKIEEAKTPSVVTANSYVASVQAEETLKILMGYEEFKRVGKWPQNVGQPLSDILIADLKFNRYSTIQLKRNSKCIVCGEKGIAKPVEKLALSFDEIGDSTSNVYYHAERLIGSIPDLYALVNTPPMKIARGQSISKYDIQRGSHVMAITNPSKSNYAETILEIV